MRHTITCGKLFGELGRTLMIIPRHLRNLSLSESESQWVILFITIKWYEMKLLCKTHDLELVTQRKLNVGKLKDPYGGT